MCLINGFITLKKKSRPLVVSIVVNSNLRVIVCINQDMKNYFPMYLSFKEEMLIYFVYSIG